jgi:cytochrome c
MKLHFVLFAAGAAIAGAAFGQAKVDAKAAEALALKSGCIACHHVDKKVVGPAYKDVAAKYKSDKDAEKRLVAKVKAGGSGVWGPVPMPPNAQVSDADVKTLVAWVLSLK